MRIKRRKTACLFLLELVTFERVASAPARFNKFGLLLRFAILTLALGIAASTPSSV
jgi:hypothetical protein